GARPFTVEFQNNLINRGTLTLGSGVTRMTKNVTLSGGGALVLTADSSLEDDYTWSGASRNVLTNVDNTIRGSGTLNAQVINQALIEPDAGQFQLRQNVSNADGHIRVKNGVHLRVGGT